MLSRQEARTAIERAGRKKNGIETFLKIDSIERKSRNYDKYNQNAKEKAHVALSMRKILTRLVRGVKVSALHRLRRTKRQDQPLASA